LDGSGLAEVAAFQVPGSAVLPGGRGSTPVLSDLGFLPDGRMVVGLRNRALDADSLASPSLPQGDLIALQPQGERWGLPQERDLADMYATGSVARLPGLPILLAPAVPPQPVNPLDPVAGLVSSPQVEWLDDTGEDL